MEKISFPAFEIEQPVGKFYIGKVKYYELVNLCSKDLKNIDDTQYDIFQRKLDKDRMPALRRYMEYSRASFPNGIVLTANLPFTFENGMMTVEKRKDAFFIIDGQHRVEALKYYKGNSKFEVCVVIFGPTNKDMRAELFTVINSEQKRVNPTVRLNLRGNDIVDTPEKVVRKIAIALNESRESPFYRRILFADQFSRRDENKISLASFAKPIISAIYSTDQFFSLKDALIASNNDRRALDDNFGYVKKGLWKYYCEGKDEIIYLILLNYFGAFADLFEKDWKSPKSILMKTTGYNAMFMLLNDLLKKENEDKLGDFSYDYFFNLIQPLKPLAGNFILDKWGVGLAASSKLYREFTRLLNLSAQYKVFDDYNEE